MAGRPGARERRGQLADDAALACLAHERLHFPGPWLGSFPRGGRLAPQLWVVRRLRDGFSRAANV
jgi:hypothetical protein